MYSVYVVNRKQMATPTFFQKKAVLHKSRKLFRKISKKFWNC
jgi:hypothetical protein